VRTELLRGFVQRLSSRLAPHASFSVVLVSDAAMTNYNLKFRGLNQSTDVLSFRNQKEDWETEETYLGDILISVETADRQRKETLLQELKLLSLHGLLHLLGYDHQTDEGEMGSVERRLKKEFQLY
jgi:probable rRNA maturation factor